MNFDIKINKNQIVILIILVLVAIFSVVIIYLIKFSFKNKTESETIDDKTIFLVNDITEESSFPTEIYGIPVYDRILEIGTLARPGVKRKIKYIVIHETDNFASGAGAKNHAEFLTRSSTYDYTSWHYTVDSEEIYHHIPDNEVAYHSATRIGNYYGIGIELCVNKDGNFDKTFDNAAKLVAYLLQEYDLTTYDIKTHHDFSGKDCPHIILENNMIDEFINKVKELM